MATNDHQISANALAGIGILAAGLFFGVTGLPLLVMDLNAGIQVGQNFTRNIEYAVSDTNPVKAAERLDLAVDYLEDKGLDKGDSCIFVYSPSCDRAEYHRKLTEASAILKDVADADSLTQSNTMIRVRESFVTYGEKGAEDVQHPVLRFNVAFGSTVLGYWLEWYAWIASTIGIVILCLFIAAMFSK